MGHHKQFQPRNEGDSWGPTTAPFGSAGRGIAVGPKEKKSGLGFLLEQFNQRVQQRRRELIRHSIRPDGLRGGGHSG